MVNVPNLNVAHVTFPIASLQVLTEFFFGREDGLAPDATDSSTTLGWC